MQTDSAKKEPAHRIPPRAFLAVGGVAAVLLVALVALLMKSPPPVKSRHIGARLELAAGQVVVEQGDGKGPALSGTPLATGAKISTGKGSRALVRTGDGAAVFLRGDTEVALEPTGLSIEKGEAWLDAPREGSEAIACKLGKDVVSASDAGLSIARAGDTVTVYVARGLAILTAPGGRVEIAAGTQGVATGDALPKVSPVAFWQDWTGGMGDAREGHGAAGSGAGRIYGVDPNASAGAPAHKLGIAKEVVHAVLRDGLAETEVDQTFSNPGGTPIEGWYWFTVPPDAIVTSFALETNGQLVEGEVIERREAAARYEAAIHQQVDPALLEWVDGRSYRARIFPIPQSGTRRVVLRYMQLLPQIEGKVRYVYPLRSDDPVRFDEFALEANLGAAGAQMTLATSLDATIEDGQRKVTMRRSGYVPQGDFQLEMEPKLPEETVRAWRFGAGSDQADYVMLRYVPDQDVDFAKLPPAKGELVLVVDTSAGGDESARAERTAAAEAILRALSDEDRFALVALDVAPAVVYPKEGLAPATDAEVSKALERLSDHGVAGATDLGSMFEPALERLHGAEQPAVVYVGDGNPTSGETSPDALLGRMRRSLSGSRARFFAVGVGADARHELLSELTRAGAGQYLRIDEADQTTGQALRLTSAIKTPTITDLSVDLGAGLDQPFYSQAGKLARGEEMVLLARTHHELPRTVAIQGRVGGKDFRHDYPLRLDSGATTALVPRLWAAEYVRRLLGNGAAPDDNRSKVLDLGTEYGLMTPYTSILALESEEAYARQGIARRSSRLRGLRLTSIESESHEERLLSPFAPPGLPLSAAGCARGDAPEAVESTPAARAGVAATAAAAPSPMASPVAPQPTTAVADDPGTAFADKSLASSNSVALRVSGGGGGTSTQGASLAKIAASPAASAMPASPPPPPPAALVPLARAPGLDHRRPLATHDAKKEADLDLEKDRAATLPTPPTPMRRALATCTDAASRPLSERLVLWQKRLKRATNAADLVAQYEAARAGCELPDWRDQAALLGLIEARVDNEAAAQAVLGHFAGEQEAQRFVARAILRRTVDAHLAAAVSRALYGDQVDWAKLDRELLDLHKPDERLAHLKAAMLVADGDPQGDVRLVKLLVESGDRDGALAHGRRMRDRGLLTPTLAEELGDVLVSAGEPDEALRTYSEVVEFDSNDPVSRRVLGDIYLRNGWFDAAYRQYKTLTDLEPKTALAWLRLASAAAGAGRVDEALRIEREVQTGKGSPGPDDPRYWARLWSSVRLGALLSDPAAAGGPGAKEALARKLKELGLFSGPGTLAVLTWQDHDVHLALGAADPKKEALLGEPTDASPTGLYAVLLAQGAWDKQSWAVRPTSDVPSRPVPFTVTRLSWDGKAFAVTTSQGSVKPEDKLAAL